MPRIRIRPRNVSRVKPRLGALRFKGLEQMVDFLPVQGLIQGNKQIRPPDIAVILRNFIFQDQVIPKRVPGQAPRSAGGPDAHRPASA